MIGSSIYYDKLSFTKCDQSNADRCKFLPCWRTWSLKSLSLEKALPQCSHTRDSVWTSTRADVSTEALQHPEKSYESQRVCLTHWLGLSVEVVKQLCVAGEHAATRGTGYKPLLSVAPHVFSQAVPDLEEGIAACERNRKAHYVSAGANSWSLNVSFNL